VKPLPLIAAAGLLAWLVLRWKRHSNERRILLVLAVAALAVYGSGAVHFPNIEHAIRDLGNALGKWTYLLVGLMAFLETGAGVGLLVPGETVIVVGGVVAGQGKISVVLLIGIVWFAAVAGDSFSYYIGRRLGRDFLLRHGPRVKITEARIEQVERFFDRHGGKAILLGRFIGLVRAIAPFIAGASRLSFRRFLPYDVIGCGLWASALVLLGYIFWRSFDKAASIASKGFLALGTLIVLVVAVVNAIRFLRVPENRARARAWIDEQAQRPLVRPLARALRPVYRHVVAPVARFLRGPAKFFWDRITPGMLGLELTTLIAVAAVGSYVFFALAGYVGDHAPFRIDTQTLRWADDIRSDMLTDVAKAVTTLGRFWIVGPLVGVLAIALAMRRRMAEALTLAVAAPAVSIATQIAKASVDRPRPSDPLVETAGSSFPSGHAANAIAYVAIAIVLMRVVPRFAHRAVVFVIGLVVALAVGASRVYLRAHWYTDVLGGYGEGLMIWAVVGAVALIVVFLRQNGRPA
jgi:membrane protein DedA with SNARE-associated domain